MLYLCSMQYAVRCVRHIREMFFTYTLSWLMRPKSFPGKTTFVPPLPLMTCNNPCSVDPGPGSPAQGHSEQYRGMRLFMAHWTLCCVPREACVCTYVVHRRKKYCTYPSLPYPTLPFFSPPTSAPLPSLTLTLTLPLPKSRSEHRCITVLLFVQSGAGSMLILPWRNRLGSSRCESNQNGPARSKP